MTSPSDHAEPTDVDELPYYRRFLLDYQPSFPPHPIDAVVISSISPERVRESLTANNFGKSLLLILASESTEADAWSRAVQGRAEIIENTSWSSYPGQSHLLEIKRCADVACSWDLPAKRNFALECARSRGWERVLLLDDDIRGITPELLGNLGGSLSRFCAAGFFPTEFPDTSVVGHAALRVGLSEPIFLSGSCLGIRADQCSHGFIPVYNEDWLFLLPLLLCRKVNALGNIQQLPYDPFDTVARARFQEFGEVLVEGMYRAAFSNELAQSMSVQFWRNEISLRARLIRDIVAKSEACKEAGMVAAGQALNVSLAELDLIQPSELKDVAVALLAYWSDQAILPIQS